MVWDRSLLVRDRHQSQPEALVVEATSVGHPRPPAPALSALRFLPVSRCLISFFIRRMAPLGPCRCWVSAAGGCDSR